MFKPFIAQVTNWLSLKHAGIENKELNYFIGSKDFMQLMVDLKYNECAFVPYYCDKPIGLFFR